MGLPSVLMGRIRFSGSKNTNNLRNPSRINMNRLPRGARQMLIHEMRDRTTTRMGSRRVLVIRKGPEIYEHAFKQ